MDPYTLGYELGLVYGQLVAEATTPAQARAYDRAAVSLISAAGDVAVGIDAASYEDRARYVEGVNEGRAYAVRRIGLEYGHDIEAEAARA